jgi:regulatory protein
MDEPPQPPRILEIRPVRHGRQRLLVLDDGRELPFDADACDELGIRSGDEATEELLRKLQTVEQRSQAHAAALRLLSHRARSEKEMRTRLGMRGIAPDVIDAEIERLQRAGLLDDEQFARAWVEDRKRLAPRGRRMLRYELLGRGIPPESVDLATRDVDDLQTALDLARTRAHGDAIASYDAFLNKVGGFLRRRGFDYSVISQALRTVWAENPEAGRSLASEEAVAEFP